MADLVSLIPPWGWLVTAAFAGSLAGQAPVLLLFLFARPRYCPRCTYYLGWRDHLLNELKTRPPKGKPQDLWERENP